MDAKQAVERILKELDGRGGFDEWWGNIDKETQAEIKGNLLSILSEGVDALILTRQREIRIDKNKRGKFECWEPDGMGPGKHALFLTVPTMKEALARVREQYYPCRLKLVLESPTEARFVFESE